MHRFYFNECLPQKANQADFVNHLANTIQEYNKIYNYGIGVERGVVTQKLPSEILFQNGYTLLDVIQALPENEIRTLAYSIFGRNYPINAYFDESHDELLENMSNYRLVVDGTSLDALNLAIVQFNDGFLFTPGMHADIAQHPLIIENTKTAEKLEVDNLFGVDSNTEVIRNEIIQLNNAALGLYDQLLQCIGAQRVTSQFPRDFNSLTKTDQENVIQHFAEARDRNGNKPFFPDGDLIKDVTPERAKNPVYELRIFKPRALRIYFSEKEGIIYLASIGFKASGDQNNDIRAAKSAIDKLIIVGK